MYSVKLFVHSGICDNRIYFDLVECTVVLQQKFLSLYQTRYCVYRYYNSVCAMYRDAVLHYHNKVKTAKSNYSTPHYVCTTTRLCSEQ